MSRSDDAVELGVSLTETIGELHGAENQSTCASDSVGQEPPLEWLVVFPDGVVRVDEEMLVVAEYIKDHKADEAKERYFARGRESRGTGKGPVDISVAVLVGREL